jgi:hypothetical protein
MGLLASQPSRHKVITTRLSAMSHWLPAMSIDLVWLTKPQVSTKGAFIPRILPLILIDRFRNLPNKVGLVQEPMSPGRKANYREYVPNIIRNVQCPGKVINDPYQPRDRHMVHLECLW